MITKIIITLLLLQNVFVYTYRHQKYLHKTLWNERCQKHDVVLNDCNWCKCDSNHRYICKARVCDEVDMFGHFKDAIQNIDVGMEGHGVWRTTPTACTPGVQYKRGDVLCVCNEDGNWPNAVCRDTFRILHPITEINPPTTNFTCTPNKLYLIGCNVCFCLYGYLDNKLCTNNTCYKDYIVDNDSRQETKLRNEIDNDLEIYANCKPNVWYGFGCMSCKCLKNNRLLCDPCVNDKTYERISKDDEKSTCSGRGSTVFNVDCNMCYCDADSRKICSVRNCLTEDLTSLREELKLPSYVNLRVVQSPLDYEDCIPGTTFTIGCNSCGCIQSDNGKKIIQCSIKQCNQTNLDRIKHDCVENTLYEWKCMTCYCRIHDGVKTQTCTVNRACTMNFERRSSDIKSLNGYCEPLHTYNDDCNKCRCVGDGDTLVCSSNVCDIKPVSVDVVPFKLRSHNRCPKGRSFKISCNMCFCLANGNSMCTTSDCGKNTKVYPIVQH